jgi:hypothetical protein
MAVGAAAFAAALAARSSAQLTLCVVASGGELFAQSAAAHL